MNRFMFFGGLFGFVGVLAGALGSHALKDRLVRLNGGVNFEIATNYMFYHALGLILIALIRDKYGLLTLDIAGWLFVAGCVLFQGNLYLLAATGASPLQMLTPVGGLCLMAGWLLLAVSALRVGS